MHTFTQLSKTRIRVTICLLLLGLALCLPAHAYAQANSPDAAAQQALSRLSGDGKVLSVREKTNNQGKRYYEVQVISNGNVRIFNIPRS